MYDSSKHFHVLTQPTSQPHNKPQIAKSPNHTHNTTTPPPPPPPPQTPKFPEMPPMTSLPPPLSTIILTLLGALTGYYIGKTSGVKTGGRIKELKSSPPVSPDDSFTPASPTAKPSSEDNDDDDDDWATTSSTINPYTNLSEDCKMVFVVRTDLSMTKGKIAAQCGHATLMCYKSVREHAPGILERWERLGQAKIALKCSGGEEGGLDGEEELETLAGVAASLGVVAGIVRDAGRTQIKAGSATVLGVGPAPRSIVDQITGHLKLL